MNLQNRIEILTRLGEYMSDPSAEWMAIKEKAARQNAWFTPAFIDLAIHNIAVEMLQKDKLEAWAAHYHLDDNIVAKNVGVVMAGNIPLVGFHDFLSVFISGHKQTIKLSSKDDILLKHLAGKMTRWIPELEKEIRFAEMLKGCDAYIATGSNNSGRYFEQYFAKYPHIIRRNRTSVAILAGDESPEQLQRLSEDVHDYFGMGCRNVTKIFIPKGYDFIPLLKSFDAFLYFKDHNKYRNNYDYQLSLALLNNIFYMTNETTLMIENEEIFSPISQLNYSFYEDGEQLLHILKERNDIQCTIGKGGMDFGKAQRPGLFDYADGLDTLQFLLTL